MAASHDGLDVDAPAGQLGGQAGILSVAADGQAELVLLHDHGGGLAVVAVSFRYTPVTRAGLMALEM